jgi:hypothetical protein
VNNISLNNILLNTIALNTIAPNTIVVPIGSLEQHRVEREDGRMHAWGAPAAARLRRR